MFPPGTLWRLVEERTEEAVRTGALLTIPTAAETVPHKGVDFLVRVLSGIERKEADARMRRAGKRASNPFLPYEKRLCVAELTESHVCLLNKFNVVERHLLLVTKEYRDQELLLTPDDFRALLLCLREGPALGFYNGGVMAGASQPHKHLQLVPLPMSDRPPAVPIESLLLRASFRSGVGTIAELPFLHALAGVPPGWLESPEEAAEEACAVYRELLEAAGLRGKASPDGERQSAPYNLLMTGGWMLLVPRGAERFGSVSVNALGFAGALLVRDRRELDGLKAAGPMNVLRDLGIPAPR